MTSAKPNTTERIAVTAENEEHLLAQLRRLRRRVLFAFVLAILTAALLHIPSREQIRGVPGMLVVGCIGFAASFGAVNMIVWAARMAVASDQERFERAVKHSVFRVWLSVAAAVYPFAFIFWDPYVREFASDPVGWAVGLAPHWVRGLHAMLSAISASLVGILVKGFISYRGISWWKWIRRSPVSKVAAENEQIEHRDGSANTWND